MLRRSVFFFFFFHAALLDVILSEFRKRHRVTSFCSVWIQRTVAVERWWWWGGGVADGKVIVMGRLNAEVN